MKLYKKFFVNAKEPKGLLGKIMVNRMNIHHKELSTWGRENIPHFSPSTILEIGCGGGRNTKELLKKYPEAKVVAIDYSNISVDKTKKYNKKAINADRCTVLQQDVSKLDVEKNVFDLATAIETVYFWPRIEECFRNVYEALKDNGVFVIVNEADGLGEESSKMDGIIEGYRVYTAEELENLLKVAGFSDVKSTHHISSPWITVIATK
ncbi:MAG: class I SAM-dependent methyltransferase [Clostridia bacterium]|nr:class I SAM-dependent methyltransferase [Clostridia bacterium]